MSHTYTHTRMIGVYLSGNKEILSFLKDNNYTFSEDDKEKFCSGDYYFDLEYYMESKFASHEYSQFRALKIDEHNYFIGFLIGLEKENSSIVKNYFTQFKKMFPSSNPEVEDVEEYS